MHGVFMRHFSLEGVMFKKWVCVLVLCALVFSAAFADTAPKFKGWRQAETEHFRFVFEEAGREAAEAYAEIADEAWNKVAEAYALPKDKITVYVTGRTNTINAYTYFAPVELVMFTTPFIIPDFTYRDDWVKYVFTHELIHAANVSFQERKNILADLFGPYFANLDLAVVESWETDGLTTVLETELTDAGRGRSPYFELLYKAPAMEANMISYDEIGLEEEPPAGQIYVMGYLMMRSIADRFGLETLADVERNRDLLGSWDEALQKVTGVTGESVYRDVKISLVKRYQAERLIPEGKIISSRNTNDSSYRPAVVLDDGTMILLKKSNGASSVISLNPALASGTTSYENLGEDGAATKETTLFAGTFADSYAVTADAAGTVYASMALTRADRAPGTECEYQIFSWNGDDGLKQLTHGSSFFEPAVSRDGKVLVALEQSGLNMRLVKVDLTTGETSVLLEDEGVDYAMPAVSDDGTKVAFLRIADGRAAVAYIDMTKDASKIVYVANASGSIVDPGYPSWNSDGSLTWCSNDRGRLEVYEARENENGEYDAVPVVADPVGALWARKTDRGIYYLSYASSGYVIKMKPASEWGVVPDYLGPSTPGEIICFGDGEDDYKDFMPYENGDRQEFAARDTDTWLTAETIKAPVTELQNEKKFVALPSTLLRLPLIGIAALPGDKATLGFGAVWVGMAPRIQNQIGLYEADAVYYPEINNFSFDVGFEIDVGSALLDVYVLRLLNPSGKVDRFTEDTLLDAGFSVPLYVRSGPTWQTNVSTVTMGAGGIIRSDAEAFSVTDTVSVKLAGGAAAGLTYSGEYFNDSDTKGVVFNASAIALGEYDATQGRMFYGFEGECGVKFGSHESLTGFSIQGRYADFASTTPLLNSALNHGAKKVDATNPLNFVCRFTSTSADSGMNLNLYEEALCSFTHEGSFLLDDALVSGLEIELPVGANQSVSAGVTAEYSLSNKKFTYGGFYTLLKLNYIRY